MKVLHLNLYRKYFDAILKGDKVVEYRDITPYWSKRLEGRHYDIIQFRNGYAKVAPTMKVEYKGMYTSGSQYALILGDILETENVTLKMFTVTEGTPKDLTKAIQTFIKQAVIVGEYELDSMPPEYLQNLLDTMSKYPEYNKVTLDLIKILKSNDII